MKLYFLLSISLLLIFNQKTSAQSSDFKHSSKFILISGAIINDSELLHSGYVIGGGVEFPISPSFNLGGNLTFQDFNGKGSVNKYSPLSLRFTVKYYPYKVFNILGLDGVSFRNLYFKSELGPSYDFAGTKFDSVDTYILGLGYEFLMKNGRYLSFDFGINDIQLKKDNVYVTNKGAAINIAYAYKLGKQ